MNPLLAHLHSIASCVQVDLTDPWWYSRWDINRGPGWYFIRTDTPVEVLCRQRLWCASYIPRQAEVSRLTRNYNIAGRASRYADNTKENWNVNEVYSGMAMSLIDRAREHTFTGPGTAGLALGRYPELAKYSWTFGFLRLDRMDAPPSGHEVLLRLGERIWRASNGWPLLCSERA